MLSMSMAILLIFLILGSISETCTSQWMMNGLRAELMHIDSLNSPYSPGNITSTQRLQRAVKRSNHRLQTMQSKTPSSTSSSTFLNPQDFDAPVNAGKGEFLIKLAIGTPALSMSAILDTGSDLTWTQCKPCRDCYKQPTPVFDPSHSSTYSKVPCTNPFCSLNALPDYTCNNNKECEYSYTYGDFSGTEGTLSYETFTFTSKSGIRHSIPRLAFGCGHINEGGGFNQGGGVLGLGRGPLSVITQLGKSVENKFSYCLVSINDSPSKSSTIFFGDSADLKNNKATRSTPFVNNKTGGDSTSTYYYISLEGISVGKKLLNIPQGIFHVQLDGTGGFIIDSGTTITYLHEAGYDALKKELSSLIKLSRGDGSKIGLDLCYKVPGRKNSLPAFPTVTFHFRGADFELVRDNYMVVDKSGLWCLGMMPSDDGMSIFGNVQQQNYHILYDLGRSVLSFAPVVCDGL